MSDFDDIFKQIQQNNESRQELERAVRAANFEMITDLLWKIASKLLKKHVTVLKDNWILSCVIDELVPFCCHYIAQNWI